MAKCKGVTKSGARCKSEGRPETGGYCFVHYQEAKGLKADEVRVRFLKGYKNGNIPVSAGELEEKVLTRGQLEQVLADDVHALEVLNG